MDCRDEDEQLAELEDERINESRRPRLAILENKRKTCLNL